MIVIDESDLLGHFSLLDSIRHKGMQRLTDQSGIFSILNMGMTKEEGMSPSTFLFLYIKVTLKSPRISNKSDKSPQGSCFFMQLESQNYW